MTWRSRLQRASFRGVPFEVTESELAGARRKAVLAVPGRDEPFIQDLGGAPRTIRVEAFVLGDDYLEQVDRLLAAVRAPGRGRLVHPTLGEHQASVTDARVSQSNQTLGSARISIEFILGGIEVALVPQSIGRHDIGTIRDSIATASSRAVSSAADVASNRDLDSARSVSLTVGGELQSEIERLSRLDLLFDRGQELADYLGSLKGLVDSSLRTGSDWALWMDRATGSTSSLSTFYQSRLSAFRGLLGIAIRLFGLDDDGADTARVARAGTGAAVLSESAVAAAEVADSWESQDEADSARDELLAVTETALEAEVPELVEPVLNLRAAIVASVPAPSAALPQIATYHPATVEPAIIAAYRAYGDAAADDRIVSRNRITHPAFVPARDLEVLLNV